MAVRHQDVSKILLGAAIICFVIGLFPRKDEHVDPETNALVKEWTAGVQTSPAWRSVERVEASGGFESEWRVEFFSWSSLLIGAGAVCLSLRCRLLNRLPVESAQEDG